MQGDECVEACEEGWEKNGDHCYYFSIKKKNWFAAENFCRNESGHLASVHSNANNDFIWERLIRTGLNRHWIGGTDTGEEGVWKWTDCTPWNFTVWYEGEPNRLLEDCLNVYKFDDQHEHKDANKKWNDYPCSKEQGFVCSKKICSGRKYQNLQKLDACFRRREVRSQRNVEADLHFRRRDPPHPPPLLTV